MLEGLMKGLALWIYGLFLEIVEFIADSLLEVFNMDMAYFEANVPVTKEIVTIIIAAGWAILIGNLAFQALKSMMSGIGFEGEDPKILFCRTFVFAFLLVASRQICEIGLGITAYLNTLLKTPDAVKLGLPPLDVFAIPGSWLLVMIIGLVLMFQIVKFFFEIAERYVVLVMLTILSPLAFGVGGSKNTEDIFKGWARMYGSACLMMLFNTVFLKLLLSAMSSIPSGPGMLPWMMLVVAIARVARKIDDIVARIGLNVARTGDPIGRGGLMYPIMVMRTLGQIVGKTAAANKPSPGSSGTGRQRGGGGSTASPPPLPSSKGGSSGSSAPPHSPPSNRNEAGASGQSSPAGTQTQPAMSTGAPGGSPSKEAPPSRPPVGGGRERVAPGRYGGTRDDAQPDDNRQAVSGRPPLSVDSAVPGSVTSSRTGASSQDSNAQVDNSRPSKPQRNSSSAPPLSVDSRKPDMQRTGTPAPGTDTAPPPKKRFKPKKNVNIDIYRDDDPSASGTGVRGSRPASTSGGRPQQPDVPHSGGSTTRQARSDRHTEAHNHTTTSDTAQSSIRNTANAGKMNSTTNSSAPPPGHASSPMAGRVGRGVGNHGAGSVAAPGGAQRAPSTPSAPKPKPRAATPAASGHKSNDSASAAASRPSTSNQPPTRTGGNHAPSPKRTDGKQQHNNPPQAARSSNGSQAVVSDIQPPRTRPMRYRMVNRDELKQPKQQNMSMPNPPSASRSIPGRPGHSGRVPGTDPTPKGGNRP